MTPVRDREAVPQEAGEQWLPASFFGVDAVQVAVLHGPGDARLLEKGERARYDAFGSPKRRLEFVRGRTLVRRAVGHLRGVAPEAVQIERLATGELAFPEGDAASSLTHTRGLSAVALGPPCRLLGLDVERIRSVHPALMARMMGPDERIPAAAHADLVVWTAKEAILKAIGRGLRTRMASVPIAWAELAGPVLTGRCHAHGQRIRVVVRLDPGLVWALAVEETDT